MPVFLLSKFPYIRKYQHPLTMNQTTNYYQLGRKLAIRYPEFARHLMEDDKEQKDFETFIPELYQRFIVIHPEHTTRNDKTRHRLEFIAVVVKHLDPEALTTDKQLKKGVRTVLARNFNCGSSLVSHTLKTVKNYLIIYKDFRMAVEYLYSELFEEVYVPNKSKG